MGGRGNQGGGSAGPCGGGHLQARLDCEWLTGLLGSCSGNSIRFQRFSVKVQIIYMMYKMI